MKRLFLFIFICVSFVFLGLVDSSQMGVKFSHKMHIEDFGAECADCHAVDESQSAVDNLMPNHDNCYACHDEDETECGFCHTNEDDPFGVPHVTTYIAKFPHATHAAQDVACDECHTDVAKSENASTEHLPLMADCQVCHSDLDAANYCQQCHDSGEQLTPATHRLDWNQAHGLVTHLEENSCASCHTEQSCLDCHQGDNLDRKVHKLNFVNNHGLTAKSKSDNCYTCHEEQEFCVTCHREQLVMPRNHNTAGWSNLSKGGRHAMQAKMDLDNCLACHNDNYGEPVCAQCHSAHE
jgi:hypothetical protein